MKIASFVRLIAILTLTTSCTKVVDVSDSNEVPEASYCTTNAIFTTSYTITGSAIYKRRTLDNSAFDGVNYPIRRAEVQVLDSDGNIVQCTETDASGNFSFTIPDDNATYTLKVLSRSYNQYNKASVLSDPTNNIPYAITTTFPATSSHALPATLRAEADDAIDSELKGGAFNILDQIYKAHDFLLTEVPGFTVDHKIQAYWAKGVNPVGYFGGDTSSGVSFYVPGTDKLYILGGIDGDITIEDTDHFDNSVILHEFGHFIEDNYSKSDSPGGTHYGLYVIDPRLAWSEGFATFFSTQVLGDPVYRDTIGTGGSYGFYYDAQLNDSTPGGGITNMDMPTAGQLGEGGFRELDVLRSLWAAMNAPYSMPFSEFWTTYTGDFKNTTSFRDLSLFLMRHTGSATDISPMYPDNDKELDATRAHYGTTDNAVTVDTPGVGACSWTIVPANPVPLPGSPDVFESSNQFYSNDFFYVAHPGGTLTVTLDYDLSNPGSNADLDLYIYKEGYAYGVGGDLLTYSNDSKCPGSATCENGTESISVNAPAGKYMINVMYYGAAAGQDTTLYNLTVGSNLICR